MEAARVLPYPTHTAQQLALSQCTRVVLASASLDRRPEDIGVVAVVIDRPKPTGNQDSFESGPPADRRPLIARTDRSD